MNFVPQQKDYNEIFCETLCLTATTKDWIQMSQSRSHNE